MGELLLNYFVYRFARSIFAVLTDSYPCERRSRCFLTCLHCQRTWFRAVCRHERGSTTVSLLVCLVYFRLFEAVGCDFVSILVSRLQAAYIHINAILVAI